MLRKKTVENFIKKLESKEPVPGGGSAAALAGTLSAALILMAINITLPKVNGRVKFRLLEARKKIKSLECSLLRLIDKDAAAYEKVIKACKLPKDTESQKNKRSKAIQAAYKIAASAPLQTAVLSSEIKSIAKEIKNSLSKNVSSDVETAEFLAEAALKGAVANVRINLPGIKDKKFKEKASLALRRTTRLK